MDRLCRELHADDQTVRRWVREGRLARPCLRRDGRAYWSPAEIKPFRQRRLHRLGLE